MLIRYVFFGLLLGFWGTAAEVVRNGELAGPEGGIPEHWTWRTRGGADCAAKLSGGTLLVRNATARKPNVYGILSQELHLKPGAFYRLSVRIGGRGSAPAVILGKRWRLRFPAGPLTEQSRTLHFEFQAPGGDELEPGGGLPLTVLFDDIAPEVRLDRLAVTFRGEGEPEPEPFPAERAEEVLAGFRRRLAGLKKKLAGKLDRAYISIPVAILEDRLPRQAERLAAAVDAGEKRYYQQETARMVPELEELFVELETASARDFPAAVRWKAEMLHLKDGWPSAVTVDENGHEVERPVVCLGFGHFPNAVDRDLELLAKFGVNTVQLETGPMRLYPREGKSREFEPDFTELDNRLLPLLKRAAECNLKISLLLSPHYFPKWLLKKYPELKLESGYLKYEPTHPKAVEMLKLYVAAVIGRLHSSPYRGAIHSICLSNEPVYSGFTPQNSGSVARFRRYMAGRYGPVEKFNAAARRNYADYDAVAAAVGKDAAANYVFYSAARDTFTGWHRMLADEIRSIWPEVPVHTKIMVFKSPFDPAAGIDPEALGAFSDYNGNDNYFFRRGRDIAEWDRNAMTGELQLSLNPVSIANTENHIFPDREKQPVSNDHVYTAVFQQFATGSSTLVSWVYVDTDYAFFRKNPRHARLDNIYHRPGNLAAHARAGLDAMRLAPELKKFMTHQAGAAILYAPTTILTGTSGSIFADRVGDLYRRLCFTGRKVRFLSEKQLAAGEFSGVRLLYVVGAPNVSDSARRGLRDFTAGGGRIVVDELSLTGNEFGNPTVPDFVTEPLENPEMQLAAALGKLPVEVCSPRGNDGLYFRMIPEQSGTWLVNLVNYTFESKHLTLKGLGTWSDLISGGAFRPELSLKPLKPLLLRFSPEAE